MKTTEELLKEMYDKVLKSGMFWEIYPELSGEFEKDKKQFSISIIDNIKYTLLANDPETPMFGFDETVEFLFKLEQWNLEK
jgi:hypothetical protein